MITGTSTDLRAALFRSYDGFADKRLKDLSRDAPFIVDDRSEADRDARGQLFLWFCQILVSVSAFDQVRLTLRGGVPVSPAISDWFVSQGGTQGDTEAHAVITPANVGMLADLAAHLGDILKKPYSVKAYKYVIPRSRASVERLQAVLQDVWT